jgi:hypothetical protein
VERSETLFLFAGILLPAALLDGKGPRCKVIAMMPEGENFPSTGSFECSTNRRCIGTGLEGWPLPSRTFDHGLASAVIFYAVIPPIAHPPPRATRCQMSAPNPQACPAQVGNGCLCLPNEPTEAGPASAALTSQSRSPVFRIFPIERWRWLRWT